ncbi:acyl-CoA thioesterase II [Pseudomonas cavernicola]|uniref:Acyl-CoA thioesterase 2 n=1 Tax=Pseudomonas cavernicola TaxID=2320866 RepID=A0A418XPD7_9PSED|nr:acyl-CoA thioesterase II [Pseudomonas cavernicola]RJG14304.1 acyl-CoA thioesterase II [Pseudomonas cavernicola]
MSQILDDLVALLSLEQIEENLFRGVSQDLGFRQLYGGQVLGQCVSAASQTVEAARHVHSLHGYFLRPGDASLPVVYQVDRVRDGGSFSTRRVTAIQKGAPIFTCSASFQYDEEGLHHQLQMPDVPGPENFKSETELARLSAATIPERMRERATSAQPIEIRPVTEVNPFDPQVCEPVKYAWFRADGNLPDERQLHKYLLGYASDFNLLTTSMQPHGVSVFQKFMQVASLDHSIWFHNDLRMDDWLLYAMDSPWSGNARGFSRGSIFNRAGLLVASVAQEGLTRVREDWK